MVVKSLWTRRALNGHKHSQDSFDGQAERDLPGLWHRRLSLPNFGPRRPTLFTRLRRLRKREKVTWTKGAKVSDIKKQLDIRLLCLLASGPSDDDGRGTRTAPYVAQRGFGLFPMELFRDTTGLERTRWDGHTRVADALEELGQGPGLLHVADPVPSRSPGVCLSGETASPPPRPPRDPTRRVVPPSTGPPRPGDTGRIVMDFDTNSVGPQMRRSTELQWSRFESRSS